MRTASTSEPAGPGRRPPLRFVVVGVVAVIAVLAAAVGAWAVSSGESSAKDRIEADPPPALFPQQAIAPPSDASRPRRPGPTP